MPGSRAPGIAVQDLVSDPAWLPHAFDPQTGRLQFLRLAAGDLSARDFLAALDQCRPLAEADAATVIAAIPTTELAPIKFIFHSGFCRSTLLARALRIEGVSTVLNEPGIFNSLTDAGPAVPAILPAVLDLLSHKYASGSTLVIKPSNYANPLLAPVMQARGQAVSLVMSNSLPSFLHAIVRKGLAGRQWGRQVLLHGLGHTGGLSGLDPQGCAGLTDLQMAGLGWLLNQYGFHQQLIGPDRDRIASLDGDRFNAQRFATLRAAGGFMSFNVPDDVIAAVVSGPVFREDAKQGGDYAAKQATDDSRSRSAVVDEEIVEVEQLVALNARQLGFAVPVPQTLL